MSANPKQSRAPWYRQPYLWLLLSPLLVIVVADLALVVYMGRAGSGVLPGAENRVGKLLTSGETVPVESFDMSRSPNGWRIDVRLAQEASPEWLGLDFVHPARANRDVGVRLRSSSAGDYRGRIPAAVPVPMRGRLHLRSSDGAWAWLTAYELRDGNLVIKDRAP